MASRYSSPLGDNRKLHVYQIDFTAVASGKRIASTKRRVRWRFGFANPAALAAGETGVNCRGEEHDITFVWSLTSGKRMVLADGQEVHFSNSRSNLFEFSWTMKGNNVLKIVAHASPPLSPVPGFRQYDFFINGQSFFTFPKVFRIGMSASEMRGVPSPSGSAHMAESSRRYNADGTSIRSGNIASYEAPNNPDEEELYLQEAIRQSLQDGDKKEEKTPAPAPAPVDLLEFGDEPTPAALPPSTQSVSSASDPWGQQPAVPKQQSFASMPVTSGAAGQQSFSSLPVTSAPAAAPFDNFAAPGPGALVAAAPSAGYAGYNIAAAAPNPYEYKAPEQAPVNPYQVPAASYSYAAASATNPYGAPAAADQNPYGSTVETKTDPWNSSNPYQNPYATTNYGAPTSAPAQQNPYAMTNYIGAPAPAANPYGGNPPSAAPVPSSVPAQQNPNAPTSTANVFGGPGYNPYAPTPPSAGPTASDPWSAPAPISTQPNLYDTSNGDIPSAVTPQAQPTPSSIGFGSPQPDFSGFSPGPTMQEPEQTGAMNGFAEEKAAKNGGASILDQAYGKLVNMEEFSLGTKKGTNNPFELSAENSYVGGNRSLADMQKKAPPKKEIMRAPAPPPGAMVVSQNQSTYNGGQYGLQQQGYGQQPMMGGQQTQIQQPFYGQPTTMQQQTYAQQPGGYSYTPPTQPMQQPNYGQANSMTGGQPQPAQYGQPPNPFGY